MAVDGEQIPIVRTWRRLRGLPGGKRLFAWLLARKVPYTGTIGARIETLEPGHAVVLLHERRRVRNHFRSIHAVALTNLGELVTGLAMTGALPAEARGIPVHLAIDFQKKARGVIRGECRCDPVVVDEPREHEVRTDLVDEAGDVVARFTARWMVGPRS